MQIWAKHPFPGGGVLIKDKEVIVSRVRVQISRKEGRDGTGKQTSVGTGRGEGGGRVRVPGIMQKRPAARFRINGNKTLAC